MDMLSNLMMEREERATALLLQQIHWVQKELEALTSEGLGVDVGAMYTVCGDLNELSRQLMEHAHNREEIC